MIQKPLSILIVDDSETSRLLLEAVLNNKGWEIHIAKSGLIGMEKVRSIKPDLILLDLLMPQMDGYEMLDLLKTEELYSHIPVIVISAISNFNTYDVCLKKGAVDYMPKPVDPEKLLTKVQEILKHQ